jgi:predicted carbohydrate-binding protein with CBM5 and CBM33 domain
MRKIFKLFGFIFLLSAAQPVFSHGTVIYPASRIYTCYTNGGSLCGACGSSIYDWMSVLQPHTNYGNHQAYVPDGKIASGGNAKFSCLDALTTAWPATTVNHGYIDVRWRNTAPHQSEYYKVYITPLNWDPTKPLRWNELLEIGHVGKRPAEDYTTIRSFIPDSYAGKRAAIVSVWQRDFTHSHEAFYSVSDILVSGGGGCTTGSPVNVTFTNNTNCTLQYYQNNSLKGSANAGGSYAASTTVGSQWQARRTSGEQVSSFTIACGQTSYNSTGQCGGGGCTTGSPVSVTFTNNTNCTLQYYQNNSLKGSANAGGSLAANTTVGSQWQARKTSGEQVSSFTIACGQTSYNSTGSCGTGGGCAPPYGPYPNYYMKGDLVSYNGRNYESLSDALFNVVPGTAAHWWKDLGPCSSARTSQPALPVPVVQGTLNIQTLDQGKESFNTPVPKSVVIFDGVLRMVRKSTIVGDNTNVDLSNLAPGLYYLYIEGSSKPVRIKIQ